MQKAANSRSKPIDAKVTKEMALEAAAMEARLAELKLSMLQERARREAAMATVMTSGSIWSNGANGPIRPAAPTGQQPNLSSSPAAAMRAAKPSLQQHLPGRQPKPPASNVSTKQLKSSSCSSSRGSSAGTAGSEQPSGAKPSGTVPVTSRHAVGSRSGSRGESTDIMPASSTLTRSKQGAVAVAPAGSVISCDEPWSGTGDAGSCSLLSGAYDEAAAGQSFQEALKEWRSAGADSSGGNTLKSSSSMRARGQSTSGNQAGTAVIKVQTDPQTEQSSTAARPSCGSAVGSSSGTSTYFLRMLAGSRNSSSRSRTDQSTGSAEPDERSDSSSTAHVGEARACASMDTSNEDVAVKVQTANSSVQEASGGEPCPVHEGGDWLTIMQGQLQDTEVAAAALASAAVIPAADAPGPRSSEACSEALATRPASATSATVATYQQQLRMLEELELLEQQVQHTPQ